MYIFGGRTEEGQDLGDLAAFRITTKRWYTFQNMGPSPSPRSGHSMTAFGKQIVVLAGEPSSAPRDPTELSLVYVLDTGKIRYPNDQPAGQTAEKTRRPSAEKTGGVPQPVRGPSAQGQHDQMRRATSQTRESTVGRPPQRQNTDPTGASSSPQMQQQQQQQQQGVQSRLPRASIAQAPAGPPPPGQAPTPKQNGIIPQQRSKTPEARRPGPAVDTVKAMEAATQVRTQSPSRGSPKEVRSASARDGSPASVGRRTPTTHGSHSKLAAKAMEAGEAAPLARQRSLRSQRQQSLDSVSVDESVLGRSEARSSRIYGDEPKSPRLTPHQEALTRELEAAKGKIAWYSAELALARKAGYQASSPTATPEETLKVPEGVADEDRGLVEAFLMMRSELGKMQATLEQQMSAAAKRVAEVEQQRDVAVSEAAFARAKLAAYGNGSQRGTPQPDDEGSADRSTDVSRRLALALAAQSEHKSRLETLLADIQNEKRAREIAEETAEAAHKRLAEVDQRGNSLELDGLKAELHEAQRFARETAGKHAEAQTALQLLRVDKEELERSFEELTHSTKSHQDTLSALHTAVSSSSEKASLLEKQLETERQLRQDLDAQLASAKAEAERSAAEMANAARQLQDARDLAETHRTEANTHREALLAGLSKAVEPRELRSASADSSGKVAILQTQLEQAHGLVKSNEEAANAAAEKLRRAEERIAGLEAYQEQSSREGLQLRRQLQAMMKESQTMGAENQELKSLVETHQREASALTVQHGALKDLLEERGPNDRRPSPSGDSGSRFGTPELTRLRELEHQLEASVKAHDETRQTFAVREEETDRAFRERLEQLEADYQSAVHYVKGTEKMLKRMKDELNKYKTANTGLRAELDAAQQALGKQGEEKESNAAWEAERATLQQQIAELQAKTTAQITQLETQLTSVKAELEDARRERENSISHLESTKQDLEIAVAQSRADLEQMKKENSMLETRAVDAEGKVTLLLDQVEASVGNYRRQSQLGQSSSQNSGLNGFMSGHNRNASASSTATGNSVTRARGISDAMSGGSRDSDDTIGERAGQSYLDNRGSTALDSLANELDALRSHWESTNRSYRLSSQFDFERNPGGGIDVGANAPAAGRSQNKEVSSPLSPSGSDYFFSNNEWRRKLDEEEKIKTSAFPSPGITVTTTTTTTTVEPATDAEMRQPSPLKSVSPSSPTFSRKEGGLASPTSLRNTPSPNGNGGASGMKINPSSPTITGMGNMI